MLQSILKPFDSDHLIGSRNVIWRQVKSQKGSPDLPTNPMPLELEFLAYFWVFFFFLKMASTELKALKFQRNSAHTHRGTHVIYLQTPTHRRTHTQRRRHHPGQRASFTPCSAVPWKAETHPSLQGDTDLFNSDSNRQADAKPGSQSFTSRKERWIFFFFTQEYRF